MADNALTRNEDACSVAASSFIVTMYGSPKLLNGSRTFVLSFVMKLPLYFVHCALELWQCALPISASHLALVLCSFSDVSMHGLI